MDNANSEDISGISAILWLFTIGLVVAILWCVIFTVESWKSFRSFCKKIKNPS